MASYSPDLVTAAALEAQLATLRAEAAQDGIFGPGSARWRIDREAALFLGAGRALLLQLAHPWVAQAIIDHSRALDDPIARFHGTFSTVFSMVFGSSDEALAAARRLHRLHDRITGRLDRAVGPYAAGSPYFANDRTALRWVHATLTETALVAYRLVLPLSEVERDAYYAESRRFAGFFGLGAEDTPQDWQNFTAAMRAMEQGGDLAVGDHARSIAARLMSGAGSPIVVIPAWYRALTAQLLPPALRDAFGLTWNDAQAHRAARALRRLRRIYKLLPARVRFVGPYYEAQERLRRRGPSLATRTSNRFWIGRPTLAGHP